MIGRDKGTIGLHSDGKVYNEIECNGIIITQSFKKNDIIGCGFNLTTN